MCTSDRAAHHWLGAPNTQPRRAASNFYRDDVRRSDGTAMPSRAGDLQYPTTPPIFLFVPPYFLFLRRSHYSYSSEPILLSEARLAFVAVSNRASITMGAIQHVPSRLMVGFRGQSGCRACRVCTAKSLVAVILRDCAPVMFWRLLPIVFITISFFSEWS